MMMRIPTLLLAVMLPCMLHAQDDNRKVVVSGSVQSDVLIPQDDQDIGPSYGNCGLKGFLSAENMLSQEARSDLGIVKNKRE